tara:strand:+ start:250 stop:510 length:261 start_codon:yes stop_codon:yes gene_type:complete
MFVHKALTKDFEIVELYSSYDIDKESAFKYITAHMKELGIYTVEPEKQASVVRDHIITCLKYAQHFAEARSEAKRKLQQRRELKEA